MNNSSISKIQFGAFSNYCREIQEVPGLLGDAFLDSSLFLHLVRGNAFKAGLVDCARSGNYCDGSLGGVFVLSERAE